MVQCMRYLRLRHHNISTLDALQTVVRTQCLLGRTLFCPAGNAEMRIEVEVTDDGEVGVSKKERIIWFACNLVLLFNEI